VLWFSPRRWDGEGNQKKKVKLMGWGKDSLVGQQRKRKIIIQIEKEYAKRVMHSAIAHYPMPSLFPSSNPWPTPPVYVLSMTSYGIIYPFGQFGSAVLAVSPPSFL